MEMGPSLVQKSVKVLKYIFYCRLIFAKFSGHSVRIASSQFQVGPTDRAREGRGTKYEPP